MNNSNEKKILFQVAHRRGRSPGQRYRFEQYLEYLKNKGYNYVFSYLISENDDKIFYSKGNYLKKLFILLKSFYIRFRDLKKIKQFDIVFIYREALMIGSTYFEKRLSKKQCKVIVDFDDAIWLPDTSAANRNLSWLKKPSKINKILKYADMAFVGNSFLAAYASKYNKNVKIIPTTIDTDYYIPANQKSAKDKICIGWTGSLTTIKHLKLAIDVLEVLKNKYQDRIYFKIIADVPLITDKVEFSFCKWKKESEVEDLMEMDIGIMPLPDDDWSRGKCGFKGLQYMALEIPAVMSAVGVNNEIINDGINGYLASSKQEWIDKISKLIESETLRSQLGAEGRKTVIEKYSFHSQKDRYIAYFNEVLGIPKQ